MRKLTLIKPALYIYSVGFVCFFMQQFRRKTISSKLNDHPVFCTTFACFLRLCRGIINID